MTLGDGTGTRPQDKPNVERSEAEELQVNGLENGDMELGEECFDPSTDEDEPDYVEMNVEADEDATLLGDPEVLESEAEAEDFMCRDCAPEEAPVKRPANPSDPTPEEKEKHNCTHLPNRPWCPICVKARGREDAHYVKAMEEKLKGLPKVAMDYAETGEKLDKSDMRKLLIGRERWTKHTFGHLVGCKGLGDERIVNKVVKSMGETGFTKMTLKGDGEPALVQVQEAVKDNRQHETILENPPAHDPQCNGEAERAVQEVKAQIRCVKLGVEARIQEKLDARWPVMEWIIPHASDLINRYLVGSDGRTAHYRIHARARNRHSRREEDWSS